jgi:predicted metal-dependent HD superfamily phosphohydrolase
VRPTGTLDLGRWTGLWSRLGAQGDGLAIFAGLAAAYSEPARAYHNTEHIQGCLAHFDACRGAAERPEEVEAAIWFHDAVYQPGAQDNEERSAELARTALLHSKVPPDIADRIADMVLATRHLDPPAGPDTALLCDVDLAILGQPAEIFDRFERRIRREHREIPLSAYRKARSHILRALLDRPSIYYTPCFRNRHEPHARANLARALAGLAG